jgi:hypothetical protein
MNVRDEENSKAIPRRLSYLLFITGSGGDVAGRTLEIPSAYNGVIDPKRCTTRQNCVHPRVCTSKYSIVSSCLPLASRATGRRVAGFEHKAEQ